MFSLYQGATSKNDPKARWVPLSQVFITRLSENAIRRAPNWMVWRRSTPFFRLGPMFR